MPTDPEIEYRERGEPAPGPELGVQEFRTPASQNPNRTSTGRFTSNEQGGGGGGNQGGGGGGSRGGSSASNNSQSSRAFQPGFQSPPQSQSETSNKESESPMLCPPAFSYSITPYGAPYAGFGAPVAPAAPVTVVTSDGHRGHESQLNTLSDIAVGNLRESAASGRFAGVTNQIESIGNRMDANAAANRDMQLVREFTTVQKGQGDLENRLLTAIKDESIRTRDLFTEQRIRDLEGRLSNVQEARRDDRLMEVLVAISKKVGT